MRQTILKSFLPASVLGMVIAQPALAYIDPSAGGMLFQLLAVIFAVFSAILLVFSRQIRMLFARLRRSIRLFRKHNLESVEQTGATSPPPAKQSDPSTEPQDQSQ